MFTARCSHPRLRQRLCRGPAAGRGSAWFALTRWTRGGYHRQPV